MVLHSAPDSVGCQLVHTPVSGERLSNGPGLHLSGPLKISFSFTLLFMMFTFPFGISCFEYWMDQFENTKPLSHSKLKRRNYSPDSAFLHLNVSSIPQNCRSTPIWFLYEYWQSFLPAFLNEKKKNKTNGIFIRIFSPRNSKRYGQYLLNVMFFCVKPLIMLQHITTTYWCLRCFIVFHCIFS